MQWLGVLLLAVTLTACASATEEELGHGYRFITENDLNIYFVEKGLKQYCCLTHLGHDAHFIVMKLRDWDWREGYPRTYVLIDKVQGRVYDNLSEKEYQVLRRRLAIPESIQAEKLPCQQSGRCDPPDTP